MNPCYLLGLKNFPLSELPFLDFVHRPKLEIIENKAFRKLDLFPSSGEGKNTPILLCTVIETNPF
jgi:hypothetical protein